MFQDFILGSGYDQPSEVRRFALLCSSLAAEGYRIGIEPCPADIGNDETVCLLANSFQPSLAAGYSRAQFNRMNQHVCENCLQFLTDLRDLAARCRDAKKGVEELIHHRFVAGLTIEAIRQQLFGQTDELPSIMHRQSLKSPRVRMRNHIPW